MITYKGLHCCQMDNFRPIMEHFLLSEQFTDVIEIGTAWGGLTRFVKDTLPNANVITYDIVSQANYLTQYGIDFRAWSPFTSDYQFVKLDLLESISLSDKLLVLVDGGNKALEFATIAPLLKVGDHIMCHDYVVDAEAFSNYYKEFWVSHEISESDIHDACVKFNLETVHSYLNAIVWQCKRKTK